MAACAPEPEQSQICQAASEGHSPRGAARTELGACCASRIHTCGWLVGEFADFTSQGVLRLTHSVTYLTFSAT